MPSYLTLSRRDLYELAWSKPMAQLAKDFGISDVALAKRYRAVDVPVPPRGWWAKKAAGNDLPRTPLPKYRTSETAAEALPPHGSTRRAPKEVLRDGPEPQVHFGLPDCSTKPVDDEGTGEPPEHTALRAKLNAALVTPCADLLTSCAAVRRTAIAQRQPRRGEISFAKGERSGPILDVRASNVVLERALSFADTFLRSAELLGWSLVAPPRPESLPHDEGRRSVASGPETKPKREPMIGQLLVEGERVPFVIEERLREEPREPSAAELAREKREYRYHARRKSPIPTGCLLLARIDSDAWGRGRKSWYERSPGGLEERIPDILTAFLELAVELKARRQKRERQERERQEAERRQRELEERRAQNAELISQLEMQAGAWFRARMLRTYVRALRRHGSLNVAVNGKPFDFVGWAERYINAMDPLHDAARVPELSRDERGWRAVDPFKEELSRLSGHDWVKSLKFATNPSADEPNGCEG